MKDVRMYIRDALREYASLQSFKPRLSRNAQCYTGNELLDQFAFPHEYDRQVVLGAYPWLRGWGTEACTVALPHLDELQQRSSRSDLANLI